ncbi:adipocyte plasma membrane-associated protein-like isoform X2 [Thrips palmi]|nr:adipocyte plasma membrane-associated protein-like isoform X2 [Thrips palmi]XP_034250128.1 adipocyte plasma membrane-associated protein-like isoform X2 [Thrips palmi]XP_034250129.1 adipocyte plasma membrane-associated protein-like isoform X2 [Thrips palmi]
MGCLSCTWTFVKIFLLCAIITFLPGLPPHAEFKEYSVVRPKALDAELLLRRHLDKAERIFDGQITGPEAFAVYNGAVYTGIDGGFVVQIDEGEIKPVVKFGENCEDITEEHICGRPLGLKFDAAGNLYVADAYYGIFKYNIQKAEKTLLVGVDEEIEGKKSKFINDLAVAKDGTVYFTVTTTTFPLFDALYALLSPGDGRVVKYDPRSKKATVLAEGLLLPNGIALSKNEDFLVFSETAAARVMRLDLKGNNKGTVSILAEGLPGLPDNIRFDGQDGFFVALVASADESHPALPVTLAPFPNIRKFLARVLYLLEMPFIQIHKLYPNYFTRRAIHSIGHFSVTQPLLGDHVTILHLDSKGDITDALVGRDGSVSHISDMIVSGDYILLGSPYNNYIGRVPRPNAPHHVTIKNVRFESAEEVDESAARKAAEEAQAVRAREEQARKAAEAASKAKKAAEEAANRKAAEEAARLKKEAESAAQKAAQEAKAKLAAEEAKKRAAEEAQARKLAEEARAKKAAEEARAKKAAEEARAKKIAEESAKKAAEEARLKNAAEDAAKKAAKEAKAKKAAEESAKRAAEEAKAKKLAQEAQFAKETKARKAAGEL